MPNKTWVARVGDKSYDVTMDHHGFSGKYTISVDGRVIDEGKKSANLGADYPFKLDGQWAMVAFRTGLVGTSYDLVLNGRSVTSGEEVDPLKPLPVWVWLFVIACGLVLIVVRGAIPGGIAGAGIGACLLVARQPWSEIVRFVVCLVVTLVTWGAVLVLGGGLAMLLAA